MSDKEVFKSNEDEVNYQERVIQLNRVAKVVKGGRRFSFSALVTVGDQSGNVGVGFGKANEVTDAISKASQNAKKNIKKIFLTRKKTVPHEVIGRYKGSKVIIRPATPGTGIIAGGAVRSIMDVSGVHDVLAKVVGSKNKLNVTKATMDGLEALRNIKNVADRRGKKMTDLF